MITTSREVNIASGNTELKTGVRRVTYVEPEVRRNTEIEVGEVPAATPAQTTARVTAPEAGTVRVSSPVDAETMMPLIKAEEKPVQVEQQQDKQKLSSKAKFMVGVYAATALILAIIVLATGLAISGTSASVAELENTVRIRTAELNESEAALAHLSDDLTITGEATELGMVKGGSVTEIDLIEMGEATEYEARTNAFDKFCDFLSKIIGG